MKYRKWKQFLTAVLISAAIAASCGCGLASGGAEEYKAGMSALEDGKYDQAISELQKAIDQDEDRKAEAYRGEGIAYLKKKEYESAVKMFTRSLNALERSGRQETAFQNDVLFYQAEAYQKNGQTGQAEDIYEQLTGGQDAARAYLLLGNLEISQKEEDKAMEDYRKAISQDAGYDNGIAIYQTLASAGRKADGAEFLQTVLKNNTPETAEDYTGQGKVYYYLDQTDEAEKSFSTAFKMGDMEAASFLGKIYIDGDDTDKAREVFETMRKEKGQEAAAYNGLALCDIADQDYDSALENISKGLKADSDSEDLLYNEIVVYEKKLDFDTAQSKMESFLKQYPDNEDAVREEQFLKTRVQG